MEHSSGNSRTWNRQQDWNQTLHSSAWSQEDPWNFYDSQTFVSTQDFDGDVPLGSKDDDVMTYDQFKVISHFNSFVI